jgi:hypothetical protein
MNTMNRIAAAVLFSVLLLVSASLAFAASTVRAQSDSPPVIGRQIDRATLDQKGLTRMLTRDEIAAEAPNNLNAVEQAMWLTLFRDHPNFSADRYPDAANKLSTVADTPAKQLLAALRKIEEIGADTARLEGGRSALNYDPVRDRKALVDYGLSVLYERHITVMPKMFSTAKSGYPDN